MLVIIKNNNNSVFTVELEDSDTIDMVKAKIQDEWGVPPDQQALIYADKRLVSGTVNDNNIKEFDVVTLVTPTVVGLEEWAVHTSS